MGMDKVKVVVDDTMVCCGGLSLRVERRIMFFLLLSLWRESIG